MMRTEKMKGKEPVDKEKEALNELSAALNQLEASLDVEEAETRETAEWVVACWHCVKEVRGEK